MTARRIRSTDSSVPPLSLPPGALSHADREYDYDVERDPPTVEPIEHQVRLDFMRGDPIRRDQLLGNYNHWSYNANDPATQPWCGVKQKPTGFAAAEASCAARIHDEEKYYEHAHDDAVLADAPAFLAARIRHARSQEAPHHALREERKRRETWYHELIPGANLCQVLKASSYGSLLKDCNGPAPGADDLLQHNAFIGVVIVDDETDPNAFAQDRGLDSASVLRESVLSHASTETSVTLSDFGIERPAPLLVGEYATGSRYPLVPWGDALTCSCPYKQSAPHRVICKHELLASVVCGARDSIFLPLTQSIDVPHRARRFVSPDVAVIHQS